MLCDCSVRCFVFGCAVRRNKNGSHHCKRTECGRYHVAHNIAVIVFARPDESAFAADNAGNGIINQRVEICQSEFFKFGTIIVLEFFFKHAFELAVVNLCNRVLC